MALRISIPSASIRPWSPGRPAAGCPAAGCPAAERWLGGGRRSAGGIRVRFQEGRGERVVLARSNMETAVTVGKVTEVDKDTFWPIVEAAAPKVVVLDMYTQWCGPCKVMAPKYQELSEKYLDVVFLKLDCNQDNRPLAKDLGIRVVPTFKILKEGKVVKEVTGAKYDDLVLAIEAARAS